MTTDLVVVRVTVVAGTTGTAVETADVVTMTEIVPKMEDELEVAVEEAAGGADEETGGAGGASGGVAGGSPDRAAK